MEPIELTTGLKATIAVLLLLILFLIAWGF